VATVLADGEKSRGLSGRNGPVSPQDRWEEDPGYTPFTVAAEIAALLAAADWPI
jgi:glucoamylase